MNEGGLLDGRWEVIEGMRVRGAGFWSLVGSELRQAVPKWEFGECTPGVCVRVANTGVRSGVQRKSVKWQELGLVLEDGLVVGRGRETRIRRCIKDDSTE